MSIQLDLFRGKRQRGVKPPPALEFALHCAVADTIRRWILPGWKWTHFPAGENFDHRTNARGMRYSPTGNRLKRMGTQRGWPDLLFSHEDGRMRFLELKRKGEKPSEEQQEIGAHLLRAGHGYFVTDSYKEAVAKLVDWKVVRGMEVQ